MGREIRMVPPNWEHPKGERRNGEIDYLPMYDEDFETVAREWLDNCIACDNGTRSELKERPEMKINIHTFRKFNRSLLLRLHPAEAIRNANEFIKRLK